VLSADSGRHFFRIAWENVTQTTVPLAFMTSAALILVVLWQRSPALSVALVGPLLAIALYQRSTSRALRAMRLAFTDPLTGLGNHRSFFERLQRELAAAEREGGPALSLCLVDIDDFKTINDRFGHPLGDEVLRRVASYLRQGGESFRLGGDEFAVLLPGHDERAAAAVADSIVARVGAAAVEGVGSFTVSAGVATYSVQGGGRDELIRLADSALYWAKDDGKNRVRTYRDDPLVVGELTQAVDGPDRESGSHEERVADLAARIARRLGAEAPEIELIRHSARLHDVGHVSLAEIILLADEYDVIATERHGGGRSSPRRALAELERASGGRLDPTLLEALAAELGLGPRSRTWASQAT
jgi:diguanylate cyclase (GGDEF)-like protein